MPPAPDDQARRPVKCPKCRRRFIRKLHLTNHIQSIHTDEKSFKCDHCDYTAGTKDILHQHLKRRHHDDDPAAKLKSFSCSQCEFKTSYRQALNYHMTFVHRIGGDPPKFQCPLCPYVATQKSSLTVHLRIHTGEKPFKCEFVECTFATTTAAALRNHERIHSEEKPFRCPQPGCLKGPFKTRPYLSKHHRYHHERKWEDGFSECPICKKKFRHLKSHLEVHDKSTIYPCPHSRCPYQGSNRQSLRGHIRYMHRPEKKLKCPFCNHATKDRQTLTNHLRTHPEAPESREEKRFKCSFCPFECHHLYDLQVHIHGHTGEKPFACKFCEFRTTQQSNLNTHERRVHHKGPKRFACPFCDYRSMTKSHRDVHLRTHTCERPFMCDWPKCSYSARHSETLRNHRKKAHSLDKGVEEDVIIIKCKFFQHCHFSTTNHKNMAIHLYNEDDSPFVLLDRMDDHHHRNY